MTVKEMVVDVRTQLQRIAANRSRKLQDDQIDWFLNKTQLTLIESAVKPVLGSGRYQILENKHGIISNLVVNRYEMQATWNGQKYMSILPSDFWYLLDDGSRVAQLCTGDVKVTGHEVLNITRVPFPFSSISSNYYTDLQLTYNNSVLFSIVEFLGKRQRTWTGLPQKDAHFYVRDLILQELTRQGLKVYWENFYTFQYPYHLIFVNTGDTIHIRLQIDGTIYSSTNEQLTGEIHTSSRQPVLTPNSMVSSDREMASSVTPYFKTSYISPISEKGAGLIYTHGDDSFIVYNTTVNYIRKPAVISLSLGTNCELSPDVHQELCNKTTETILNRLDDPDWKEVTQQNTINNQ